jgi:actin-related protein
MTSPVVVENGERWTKVGFSGDDHPLWTFRTVIADRRHVQCGFGIGMQYIPTYIGDAAIDKRDILKLRCPIADGHVKSWRDFESILDYTLRRELRADPEEQPLLITETLSRCKSDREQMTQILFETLDVPATFLASQAVLSLYASGRTTGVVLDSGENITRAVPIYEGHAIPSVTSVAYFGGKHLTDYLYELCRKLPNCPYYSSEKQAYYDVKENTCYVALDYECELGNEKKVAYELPDGSIFHLGNERFMCTEAMFNTKVFDGPSIHDLVINSILKCDATIRNNLYNNIVLAGGNTMFPGLCERINKEIIKVTPASTKVKVISSPERKDSVWIGGSIFAMQCSPDTWITKEMYEEHGASIVHSKCPMTSLQAEALSSTKSLFKCRNDFVDVEMY